MPVFPIAAAITAGASLLGTGANAYAQGRMNRKTREWNEKMFGLQNQRDLQFWNLQNEYNSPTSQMSRLRQAGINPNVAFSSGAGVSPSPPIHTSTAPNWSPRAPDLDFSPAIAGGISTYYDTKIKEAQLDNLKTQNTVLINDALLKAANTASAWSRKDRSDFDLGLASDLRQTSLDAAKENLRKLTNEANYSLSENERRTALTSQSLLEGAERILNMRMDRARTLDERHRIQSDILRIKMDTRLKELDVDLKEQGINPQDPVWMRILGRLLGSGTTDSWDPAKSPQSPIMKR